MRDQPDLSRVIVIGSSCAGKTSFARALAAHTGATHIELDALYWDADWTVKATETFRALTSDAVQCECWIADGNYRDVRDIVWPHATLVCWLNYSFPTVFVRALQRTIRRVASGTRVYGNNRETFRRSFLSRHSILLWVLTTFARRRQEYRALRAANHFGALQWREFRTPRETRRFLDALR